MKLLLRPLPEIFVNFLYKGRLFLVKRRFRSHRLGRFWCEKHWQVIVKSQLDKNPINPAVAALGISEALYLKDVNPNYVRENGRACCILIHIADSQERVTISGKELLNGIFERSKGWK